MFKKLFQALGVASVSLPAICLAEPAWTDLVVATDFDGIKSNVTTTVTAIIAILIIIVAGALIARAFTH